MTDILQDIRDAAKLDRVERFDRRSTNDCALLTAARHADGTVTFLTTNTKLRDGERVTDLTFFCLSAEEGRALVALLKGE